MLAKIWGALYPGGIFIGTLSVSNYRPKKTQFLQQLGGVEYPSVEVARGVVSESGFGLLEERLEDTSSRWRWEFKAIKPTPCL